MEEKFARGRCPTLIQADSARRRVRWGVAVLLFAACGARTAPAGTVRHDRDPQAYVGLGASPAYQSVGQLDVRRGQPSSVGSGTLVTDRWVLTAAHLLDGATDMKFKVGGREYRAEGWISNPKFNGDLLRGYDVGLVRLSEPVTGVDPANRYRGSRERGQTAAFVGFGLTGSGAEGVNLLNPGGFDGVKRAGTNVIDDARKGASPAVRGDIKYTSRFFVTDFDNPASAGDSVTGTAEATDLEFLISVGDSGGAAFVDFGKGKGPELAGVHSFGRSYDDGDDSDYGDLTGHVRVSKFNSWINSTLKKGDKNLSKLKGFVPASGMDINSMPDFVTASDPAARQLLLSTGADFAAIAAVPEPAGLVPLALGAALGLRRRCGHNPRWG